MELRHLRHLIAVSEASTFVKAAERLHLAQPALSRQIRALENELGTDVFVRGRNGVSLTPAGAICLGAARMIVRKIDSAVRRASMADEGRVGSVGMYLSVWTLLSGFSARIIKSISETEPGIQLSFEEGGAGGHWGSVRSGAVDLAVATKPPPGMTDLASQVLVRDVVNMALLPRSHRLAGRSSIRIGELKDETLLLYEPSVVNYFDHNVDLAFDRANFNPSVTRIAPSSEALVAMVSAGVGWSIHRESLMGKIPGVAMVKLEDFELPFPVELVWRRNETRPAVHRVMNKIRELAASEYPESAAVPAENSRLADPAVSVSAPRDLELHDFRYFVAAVEEQSIGKAAGRLGISQPALSRQLRKLERDVGVELLDRSPRGVAPTAGGQAFYEDSIQILADVMRLPSELARGKRAITGRCKIAVVASSEVREIVERVMKKATKRFPSVELDLQTVPTPLQPEAVNAGTFDIGICHPFPALVAGYPQIDCRKLSSDEINLALLPAGHALSLRGEINLDDLADIPFLFFPREFHPSFHDHVTDLFRSRGFRPRPGPVQDGLHTMWALAAGGEGWCLGFGQQRLDPPPGLVAVPIRNFSIAWGVVSLTRLDESRPITLAILDLIIDASTTRYRYA